MDLKHELQSQKFYDLLQNSGGQNASATIELIMRTLDQEDLTVTHNTQQGFNPNNNLGLVNMSSTSSTTSRAGQGQIGQTLELDPNVVLQTFSLSVDPLEESSCSSSTGDRPHVCQLCQASYKTRTHLRRHMVIHLNNRPYPCECGKGFNRKEHLTKHIEAVHSGTKYRCSFCAKEISRKDHLSRHIKNMHPNYVATTKDGNVPDPSILKVQLPCGQKQKAQLSFLTPGTPTTAFSSAIVGQTLITPVTTSTSSSTTTPTPKSKPMPAPTSTSNTHATKSQSYVTQTQVLNANSSLSPSSTSTSTLRIESQAQTPIKNDNDTDDNPLQQHTQIILDSDSFQHLTILPGSIVIPQITTISSVANSTTNGAFASSSSTSSPRKAKVSQNNSNQNQNGLLGLTNLSITLGGQIREAPFANCGQGQAQNQSQGDGKIFKMEVYNCTECSSSFTSEKDLSLHLRSHKPQNFRCNECPRAYTRREKLTEHIRCFHQGQKFKCEHCGKELSRKDHVLRHVRSIHPEVLASRFTAEHQENAMNANSFNGEENRLQQQQSSSSGSGSGTSTSTSSTSGNGSKGSNSRSNSSAMNEMGVLLRSICQYCLKVFGTSYHLSRHIESCHNGDIRPYSCSSCSKQFKRKDHLTKHMKSHCPNIRDTNLTNHNHHQSFQTANANSIIITHARKSLPNLNKIKNANANGNSSSSLSCGQKVDDIDIKVEKQRRIKMENGFVDHCVENGNNNPLKEEHYGHIDIDEAENDNDSEDQDMDINETDEMNLANLAMINSFIAQNVNVVVEEEDLSSLLEAEPQDDSIDSDHDSMPMPMPIISLSHSHSNNSQSDTRSEKFLKISKHSNSQLHSHTSSSSTSSHGHGQNQNQMTTYPCGHCQKEWPSRDQLLDHLQEHTSEDLHEHSNHNSQLRSIQFSNY